MKKEEPYELRLEMAHMHDEFLGRLDEAMKEENYIEASWLCYAIFEQRITRIVEKHISKCKKEIRNTKNAKSHVSISTRIKCLNELCKRRYGVYQNFDTSLLGQLSSWCKRRNNLMHGLVSLEHYKKYDEEFKRLAKDGYPLVRRLYSEAAKVREWCRAGNSFGVFPDFECRCKKYKCMEEEEASHG